MRERERERERERQNSVCQSKLRNFQEWIESFGGCILTFTFRVNKLEKQYSKFFLLLFCKQLRL